MWDFVGEEFIPPVKSAATETPRDGYRVLAVTDWPNGIRPMLIYPLGGILVIGAVMCGINPVMGIINTAMTDWLNAMGGTSKVLLGAIVAGMMSIDMGGPFNKAAYVFGTTALASGNYGVMAAVMVGGMVPPIAIALSTTFCPKKWSPDERRNGIVNYVMGL